MPTKKQNLLTAILGSSLILFVFYGDLIKYPSVGKRHRIHTIHLDVRLEKLPKFSPNDKNPNNPISHVKTTDKSLALERIENPTEEIQLEEDPTSYFEDSEDLMKDVEALTNPSKEQENASSDVNDLEDATPSEALIYVPSPDRQNESSLIDDSKFQKGSSNLERHFMIFLVPSTPNSWKFRHSMRTKWLNQSHWREKDFKRIDDRHLDFKLMFIIGKDIEQNYSQGFLEELSQNNDMYLMDLPESRKILKEKVLFGIKESIKRFDYDFLIKFDHDTLVDLPRLGFGVPKLSKENLFTGSCGYRLWSKTLSRSIHYCSGGAYILSRDVIEKIAALNETETEVMLGRQEPEDAYIGVLVKSVQEKFNLTTLRPKYQERIVNRHHIHRRPGHFWYKTWFVHGLKGWSTMDKGFNCRVSVNLRSCPQKHFVYRTENSTHCVCINRKPLVEELEQHIKNF